MAIEYYTASDTGMPWVLTKNGYFYAHNHSGYVSRVMMAEIYTEQSAKRYAAQSDETEAYPLTEFITNPDDFNPFLMRMILMQRAMLTERERRE